MIWTHKRSLLSNNSNLATIYFACSCLLCIAQSAPQDQTDDYQDEFEFEDDQPSQETSNTNTTITTEGMHERGWKIGLDQVYFAPRWEGEGPPNFTDHPRNVHCKKDYWWRFYVDRLDPPPPHIYARYLQWKRTSIDPSNVTTTTNTANVFIGTYEPSNESDDREIPLNGRVGKRSVQNDQILGMLKKPVDDEGKKARKFRRRYRRGITSRFAKYQLLEPTPFEVVPTIYPPRRVKRMSKKKKKPIKPAKPTTTTVDVMKGKTTTTTRRIKITSMDPSRKAKIQKQIRLTAVPNLRKLTADEQTPTTGIWDKLTGLPFYSTTAEWATPTQKSRPQFNYIKAVDPDNVESTSTEEDSESLEAGDESVSSVNISSRTSNEIIDKQVYDTTSLVRTIIKNPPERRKSTNEPSTYNSGAGISSPGPDASANEVRRYYWKIKQMKRGVNTENENGPLNTIWYNREDSIVARILAGFWYSHVVGLLFSLVSELQK